MTNYVFTKGPSIGSQEIKKLQLCHCCLCKLFNLSTVSITNMLSGLSTDYFDTHFSPSLFFHLEFPICYSLNLKYPPKSPCGNGNSPLFGTIGNDGNFKSGA
jgi:hypothetical protein